MSEDPTRDSPESRTIRIVCRDSVVDLYIKNRYWTVDSWIRVADGWHHSNAGEIVQDRYRLRAGFTDLDSGTPHKIVLDTLVHNSVLPEFRQALEPDPAASRIPGTSPGPAAHLAEQVVSETKEKSKKRTELQANAVYGDRYADKRLTGLAVREPVSAAPMMTSRANHTATLLPDGTVLVVGGTGGSSANSRLFLRPDGASAVAPDNNRGPYSSSELFDPTTGIWRITGSMFTARSHHTATLLPNGTVLVAGGETNDGIKLASAEVYEPATGTWSTTASMEADRINHSATLLPNGTVLVTGGRSEDRDSLASAELYDPATGRWSAAESMKVERSGHTATLLANGTVLVCGGIYSEFHSLEWVEVYHPESGAWLGNIDFPELYAPVAGTWLLKADMSVARSSHCATLLPNGTVLVAGGITAGFPNSRAVAGAELYDPVAGTWSATENMEVARYDQTATLMPDGTVLVVGGRNLADGESAGSAELFDPGEKEWSRLAGTGRILWNHTATLLADGAVLIAGGTVGEHLFEREAIARAAIYR